MKVPSAGLAWIAAICLAQSGWSAVATHFDPKAPAIRRVCVMPAEAHLMRAGMKGGESLPKESEEWAAKLGPALTHAITEAGGEVSLDELKNDEEARQAALRLQQKYESIAAQMRKKFGDVKKGRFTLGDEISLLSCARQADSVAFIDAVGTIQTGGRKTFSVLTGGVVGAFVAMSRYEIWIAFVDARTGEITAVVRVNSLGGKAGTDPDAALNKRLVSEFKKLSIGTSAPRPSSSPRQYP